MTQIQRLGKKAVVVVDGRMGTMDAKHFESDVNELIKTRDLQFELDCRTLTFVSSIGLRVIQETMQKVLEGGGSFKMTNVRPEVYKVLVMTGFTKFINVEPIR